MPARPQLVGDYLSDLGEGYARATLRRQVAAIARANRHDGHRVDTGNPSIRDLLRGIGRTHGSTPKRVLALATGEIRRLVVTCPDDTQPGAADPAIQDRRRSGGSTHRHPARQGGGHLPRPGASGVAEGRRHRAWAVFRAVTRHGTLRAAALSGEAVRLIVLNRARLAGIKGSRLEPVSPHGLRCGPAS